MSTLQIGERFPSFSLRDSAGQEISSEALTKDGEVAITFFKVSCPTCQFAIPFLKRAVEAGVRWVAISQDGAAATDAFAARFDAKLSFAFDRVEDGYPASNAFGIHHVPTTFVLSPDGRIEALIEGFEREGFEELGVVFQDSEQVPRYKPG